MRNVVVGNLVEKTGCRIWLESVVVVECQKDYLVGYSGLWS